MYCPRVLFAIATGVSLVLTGCAADPPLVPPSELKSIKRTAAIRQEWQTTIGGKDNSSVSRFTPFVDGRVMFVATFDGSVSSVDVKTGKKLWQRKIGGSLASGVGGDATQIYVANRDGEIVAMGRSDGKVRWKYQMSSEVLVPASTTKDTVVVRAADGRIAALDPTSGTERWSIKFEPPALTVSGYSQPLVLGNGVLVGLDDGKIAALSLDRGQLLWQTVVSYPTGRSEIERLVDVDANIVTDDSHIYAVSYQGHLVQIEPSRGNILWSVEFSSTAGLAQTADTLFLADTDSRIVAIRKSDGVTLWEQKALLGRKVTKPVLIGDSNLVVVDFEGFVHTLSRTTGQLSGRSQPLKAGVRGIPSVQQNTLFVQSSDGKLAALRIN